MKKTRTARWLKGTLISGVAAVACHAIWASLRQWAWGLSAADPDAMFAGSFELLLAGVAGVVTMPVLLWAGMRALGERHDQLYVIMGSLAWFFVGGHVVEDSVTTTGVVTYLSLFAGFCGLLPLATSAWDG